MTKVGLDARLLAGEEDDGETDIEKQKLDNNNTTTTTFPPTTQERRRREGFTDGLRTVTCEGTSACVEHVVVPVRDPVVRPGGARDIGACLRHFLYDGQCRERRARRQRQTHRAHSAGAVPNSPCLEHFRSSAPYLTGSREATDCFRVIERVPLKSWKKGTLNDDVTASISQRTS